MTIRPQLNIFIPVPKVLLKPLVLWDVMAHDTSLNIFKFN